MTPSHASRGIPFRRRDVHLRYDLLMEANAGWIDRGAYPFKPHFFDLGMGRMHYVDEGVGPPVVMVHGTPTWSFLYRKLVRRLSPHVRCLAPDHIGFGLSDHPAAWSYRPEDHAGNLAAFIDGLGLTGVTLVVHDYGGPIGLSYALERPENVQRLVIVNTWMWPLSRSLRVRMSGRLLSGPVGRFLYQRLNVSPRVMLPLAGRSHLPPDVHQQYVHAFPTPESRRGAWVFARELLGSTAWFEGLWARRDRLQDKQALLIWGLRDTAFGREAYERWQSVFPNALSLTFPDAGHLVPEDKPDETARAIAEFLGT